MTSSWRDTCQNLTCTVSHGAVAESTVGTFLLKKKMAYFPGEPLVAVLAVCTSCGNHVGKEQSIISWVSYYDDLQRDSFIWMKQQSIFDVCTELLPAWSWGFPVFYSVRNSSFSQKSLRISQNFHWSFTAKTSLSVSPRWSLIAVVNTPLQTVLVNNATS